MNSPLIKYRGNHCFECGKDTVMAYDVKNRPIYYVTSNPNATTEGVMDNVKNTTLSYMKCNSCGKMYLIDYSIGFPRPVTPDFVRNSYFRDIL